MENLVSVGKLAPEKVGVINPPLNKMATLCQRGYKPLSESQLRYRWNELEAIILFESTDSDDLDKLIEQAWSHQIRVAVYSKDTLIEKVIPSDRRRYETMAPEAQSKVRKPGMLSTEQPRSLSNQGSLASSLRVGPKAYLNDKIKIKLDKWIRNYGLDYPTSEPEWILAYNTVLFFRKNGIAVDLKSESQYFDEVTNTIKSYDSEPDVLTEASGLKTVVNKALVVNVLEKAKTARMTPDQLIIHLKNKNKSGINYREVEA